MKGSALVSALQTMLAALHETSTDEAVRRTIRFYQTECQRADSTSLESLAATIRDELSNYKTTFTDTLDQNPAYIQAVGATRVAAQAVVSYCVGLRRPELASLVELSRASRESKAGQSE